jgi:hypothetical protein
MPRDPNRSRPISQVLYRAFIIEKRHKVEAVAKDIGVSVSAFYSWLENEATLPSWAVEPLLRSTGDLEMFGAITGATAYGLRLVPAAPTAQPATPSVAEAALAAGAEAGDVLREVVELGRDGSYDATDKAKIATQIEEAEARLIDLRSRLGIRSVQ